jgi:hypothetical protein
MLKNINSQTVISVWKAITLGSSKKYMWMDQSSSISARNFNYCLPAVKVELAPMGSLAIRACI